MSSHPVRLRGLARAALFGVLLAATAVFTVGAVPMAAHAADVGTIADLQAALSPGTDATVTLDGDIYASTTPLVIDRDVTLDLAGYVLFASNITVTAGHTATIIAGATNLSAEMTIDGTLVLGSDMAMQNYATVSVGASGKIISDSAPRTLSGMYSIANGGTITTAINILVRVSGNNYALRFIDNLPSSGWVDMQVYAPTLAAAGLALPSFARTHAAIASWNAESEGDGLSITASTPLSSIQGAWGLYYAQWIADGITSFEVSYDGAPAAAAAGDIGLHATDTSPGGDGGDITDFVNFESDNSDDFVEDFGFVTWVWAAQTGDRIITGTLRDSAAVTNTVVLPVTHSGYPDEISLELAPTTVVTGTTSVAYLSAIDGYGNPFGYNLIANDNCGFCDTTVTSSDPSDVIDPETGVITFTTLGVHTITATVRMVESDPLVATATVTVVAAPVTPAAPAPPKQLAATGFEFSPAPFAALLLIAFGLGAALRARRARARA